MERTPCSLRPVFLWLLSHGSGSSLGSILGSLVPCGLGFRQVLIGAPRKRLLRVPYGYLGVPWAWDIFGAYSDFLGSPTLKDIGAQRNNIFLLA